jgi:ABC-type glycerol-3-phosphate transport system substrate-binding protein
MLLPAAKNQEAAWTFLKWWVSAETQVRFGRELESLIGAAARYNTANVRAFEQLAWSAGQRDVLLEPWGWVVGTPEVPGGYYTSRHSLNALRKVMNDNEEPRETLLDYTRTINRELTKKRAEFGFID